MKGTAEAPRPLSGYYVGKSTADLTYSRIPERKLPGFVLDAQIGGKVPTTDITVITGQREELRKAGARIVGETTGGNVTNIIRGLSKLTNGVQTFNPWVGTTSSGEVDRYGQIIIEDLNEPGISANIIKIPDGVTPHGLIVPRTRDDGRIDRTIFSYQPAHMPSEFSESIPTSIDFAVVNSLSGPNWPESLIKGTKRLKNNKPNAIPIVLAFGSTTMDAFDKKKKIENRPKKMNAVYEAIDGAEIYSGNMDELKMLLEGKNFITQGADPTLLMHLAKDVLKPKTLLVTDGKEGAYGLGQNNELWRAKMAPNIKEVESTLGAGDAFIAAAALRYFETDGNIRESLIWGSVSGAWATEQLSASGNPPTRGELEWRIDNYGPEIYPLGAVVHA